MKSRVAFPGVLVFLISFLFSASLFAQTAGHTSIKLKDNLFSIDFVDGQYGWAAGYYGCMMHTADGGKTWEYQQTGTTESLTDVDFVDSLCGWAVGYGRTVIHTEDGGKTWTKQQIDEEIFFISSVRFVNTLHGWAVGEWGTILCTEDGGKTWRPQVSGGMRFFTVLTFAMRCTAGRWESTGPFFTLPMAGPPG